jgi:hypothetical protein
MINLATTALLPPYRRRLCRLFSSAKAGEGRLVDGAMRMNIAMNLNFLLSRNELQRRV